MKGGTRRRQSYRSFSKIKTQDLKWKLKADHGVTKRLRLRHADDDYIG